MLQTTFSLHNNPPSTGYAKLQITCCHNNWAITPDPTTIEHGRETDTKWIPLLSWKHLTDVHQNFFEMGKNLWRARVTGNRYNTYFIGTKYWSTLNPFSQVEGFLCGHKVPHLKLNIPFLTFRKTIQGAFWCVNYLVTWCFGGKHVFKGVRSFVSFELPSPKQSACVQNPTSYRSWFQPGARLCIIWNFWCLSVYELAGNEVFLRHWSSDDWN